MTATIAPKLTRQQKARQLGRQGYSISESLSTVGVYYIGRPGETEPYIVDVAGETCTCIDFCRTGSDCKHIMWVSICCRWWRALEARAAKVVRSRRRFSSKHLAQFRALAPTFAAPAQPATDTRYGSADYQRRVSADFC